VAPDVFVHERALCESTTVGAGTRVWAFAHVMDGAVVGRDCNVGEGAFVEAGARLGDRVVVKNGVLVWDKVTVEDDVFLGPAMVFTNDLVPRARFKNGPDEFLSTLVRRGASIGANVTVVCGITIGEGAFIGAGAVVAADVPARAMVLGNPARRVGWMCDCGLRLDDGFSCSCGRTYRLEDEAVGLILESEPG
jgi:UDP-2-acetamido-3-amino-2,3-dideoxy-glucuronate N-acetyltransferase